MAKSKSTKKKSNAYRVYNEKTGTHYVIRLGREGFDKLKEKPIRKFDQKIKAHADFKIKKIK